MAATPRKAKTKAMLRQLLLYLSGADWAKTLVTRFWPARRVALRFVAGESLDDALTTTRQLNEQGLLVALDYLGENVTSADDTREVVTTYRTLIDRIQAEQLQAGVSLKLTHLGLDIGEELCVNNLRGILEKAHAHNVPVTIDMEGSAYTDRTLRLYRTMRDEYGFDNVGTVLQTMLRRSADDMRALMAEGARIRLCKGAYLEPPEIAYPDKADVDAAFIDIMREALQAPPPTYLEIATHDENIITQAVEFLHSDGQSDGAQLDRCEFQMLYGVRTSRQDELAAAGYRMRVYVPFGEAWYPYLMRRLAERPANVLLLARSLFSR
jgi:proline dehydrogenase